MKMDLEGISCENVDYVQLVHNWSNCQLILIKIVTNIWVPYKLRIC
jgi:hypothetical protein